MRAGFPPVWDPNPTGRWGWVEIVNRPVGLGSEFLDRFQLCTEEPLILEEEKEQEREAQFENEIENDEFIVPGETNKEVGLAALKTSESLKRGNNKHVLIHNGKRFILMIVLRYIFKQPRIPDIN